MFEKIGFLKWIINKNKTILKGIIEILNDSKDEISQMQIEWNPAKWKRSTKEIAIGMTIAFFSIVSLYIVPTFLLPPVIAFVILIIGVIVILHAYYREEIYKKGYNN